MIQFNPLIERKITNEPMFRIFKHAGLVCCVQRMNYSGALNGYVAVPSDHPLYEKDYDYEVEVTEEPAFNGNIIGLFAAALKEDRREKTYPLSLSIQCHGGLTFASHDLSGIELGLFGDVWWFGFDTAHADDLKPFLNEIDLKYSTYDSENIYRDFEYVTEETKRLAEQLSQFKNN